MTNREWMESLSDNDLAAFLTTGLLCESLSAGNTQNKFLFFVDLLFIANRYSDGRALVDWMSRQQEFKKA